MTKKLELDEQERMQRQEEAQNKQYETQERINQAQLQDKEKDRELKYYEIDKKYEEAITVASMRNQTEPQDNSLDKEKVDLQRQKQQQENALKRDQLQETKRHNIATESISKNKPSITGTKK